MDWPLVDCYCCSNHTHRGTQAHGGMSAPTTVPGGMFALLEDSGWNVQWCNWLTSQKYSKLLFYVKNK